MDITRYIIWTTSTKNTMEIMRILDEYCEFIVSINEIIICVETNLTQANIRAYLGDEMEIAVIPITESFIAKLMTNKFKEDERKNFNRFLELTKVPTSINDALDLINDRGGLEFLTPREKQALEQLTKK